MLLVTRNYCNNALHVSFMLVIIFGCDWGGVVVGEGEIVWINMLTITSWQLRFKGI